MSHSNDTWRPTASRTALERRAEALACVREFFAERSVLEVDTPLVVNAPVTDVHIHSAEVRFPDAPGRFYLHTSPEFAMKRLLAAGSGDIYQICHVARGLERGRLHNAEFTLIEWYRVGFSLEQLMAEVAALAQEFLPSPAGAEFLTYSQAFHRELAIDPLSIGLTDLGKVARDHGIHLRDATRDELLDALMATRVGPALGHTALTFVHRYPASQAALA